MSKTLKQVYKLTVLPILMNEFHYKHIFQAPYIKKIILNRGVSNVSQTIFDSFKDEINLITGQKTIVTKAKKSIANFKIREGMPLGVSVTLRNKIMYEFLDRLINIAIPRIRDFRGLNPKSFDGNGNYTLGIKEQIIFPEINYDKIEKVRGLDITICTTSSSNAEALELLKNFNMPFWVLETN